MSSTGGNKVLHCSFCGKSQHEVRKLIAGPSVYVCDECISLCNEIIHEGIDEVKGNQPDVLPKLPTPIEKYILNEYVVGQAYAKTLALLFTIITSACVINQRIKMKLSLIKAIFC